MSPPVALVGLTQNGTEAHPDQSWSRTRFTYHLVRNSPRQLGFPWGLNHNINVDCDRLGEGGRGWTGQSSDQAERQLVGSCTKGSAMIINVEQRQAIEGDFPISMMASGLPRIALFGNDSSALPRTWRAIARCSTVVTGLESCPGSAPSG